MDGYKRMIKSFVLVVSFLLLGTEQASMEPARFVPVEQGNTVIAQFDTQTLAYEKDPYRDELLVNVWLKTTPDNMLDTYQLQHYLFRMTKRQIMLIDQVDYSRSDGVLSRISKDYRPALWTAPLPEAMEESYYSAVLKYAQAHDKELRAAVQPKADNKKRKDQLAGLGLFIVATNL